MQRGELAPPPFGWPLLDEGVDPLLRVLGHHVAGDYLAREVVGVGDSEFELPVEQPLTGTDGGGALRDNRIGELLDLGIELVFGDNPVHQAPCEGSLSV